MQLPIKDFVFSLICVWMGWILRGLATKKKDQGSIFDPINSNDDIIVQLRSVQQANKNLNARLERIEKITPGFRALQLVREEQQNLRKGLLDIFDFLTDEEKESHERRRRLPNS